MQLSPRYNFRYPELTDQVSAFPPDVAARNALLLDQVIGSLADNTDAALAGKAPTSHTHTMGQVTGLDTALAGKAPTSHTHTMGQVTGLDTALAGKVDKTTLDTRVPSTLALRLDTTVGTRVFAGNTLLHGDTGQRNITPLFAEQPNNGNVLARMYGRDIDIYFNYVRWTSIEVTCQLPNDWGAIYTDFQPIVTMAGVVGYIQLASTGLLTVRRVSTDTLLRGGCRFRSKGWPVTLPGLPV